MFYVSFLKEKDIWDTSRCWSFMWNKFRKNRTTSSGVMKFWNWAKNNNLCRKHQEKQQQLNSPNFKNSLWQNQWSDLKNFSFLLTPGIPFIWKMWNIKRFWKFVFSYLFHPLDHCAVCFLVLWQVLRVFSFSITSWADSFATWRWSLWLAMSFKTSCCYFPKKLCSCNSGDTFGNHFESGGVIP